MGNNEDAKFGQQEIERQRWGKTLVLNKVIQSIVCSLASVLPPNSTSDAVTQSDCEHSIMGMTESNT